MKASLHPSDRIIVTDLRKDRCAYSKEVIPEGNHRICVLEDSEKETDFEVFGSPLFRRIIVAIAISAVDDFCAELDGDLTVDDDSLGFIKRIGNRINYVDVGDESWESRHSCVICQDNQYSGTAIMNGGSKAYSFLHEDCIDEFQESLQNVWEHSHEFIEEVI